MNKINFVFITGKVGSGKDTIIDRLVSKWKFKSFFYATRLKETVIYGGWNSDKDIKGRRLIQQVGLAFRNYNENNWVNFVISDIKKYINGHKNDNVINIVIGDARHPNEITVIDKFIDSFYPEYHIGATAIRVIGPNRDIKREMDNTTTNDISEIGLDNFDFTPYCKLIVINNTDTIDTLYNIIDENIKIVLNERIGYDDD